MIDVSAFVKSLKAKPVAVFGLGVSGLSVVRALLQGGAQVVAWDDDPEGRRQAEEIGAVLKEDISECAALVLSPGVPLHFPAPHPVVEKARALGIEILGDLEILHRADLSRKIIGITGTNGKSTTTALLHHIFKTGGIGCTMGGNIGTAILDTDLPEKDGCFLLGISSYQMDLCPDFRPDVSVFLNISPDHIDRHGTLEKYVEAKARIFEGKGVGVCSVDDAHSRLVYERVRERGERTMIPVSVEQEVEGGIFVRGGVLIDDRSGGQKEVGKIEGLETLRGAHNYQNICAAYGVSCQFGVGADLFLKALKTYPGLPHRQYLARRIGGVSYINDSKATNAQAAEKALGCYDDIYWIAGGLAKDGGLEGLEPYADKIRHAYLIGAAAEDFSVWMEKNKIPYCLNKTLDSALPEAHKAAQAAGKGTVLLAPACASWDQFRSYEKRGDLFMALVEKL